LPLHEPCDAQQVKSDEDGLSALREPGPRFSSGGEFCCAALSTVVHWYQCCTEGSMAQETQNRKPIEVERVQTGVRIEKRLLKVLKAIAGRKT